MKILLINTNPVVSRLLALCTRNADMVVDEVSSVEAVQNVGYDILFVDEASYTGTLLPLFEKLSVGKKIFLSFSQDVVKGFDGTVKKPFLPSQILHVLEQVNTYVIHNDASEEISSHLCESSKQEETVIESDLKFGEASDAKVLNMEEIVRIKELLSMDEDNAEADEDYFLEEDAYEARKIKVIKEELIAQGLEILEEDEMVEALSASVEEASRKLDRKLKNTKKRHKKKTALDEDEHFNLEEALSAVLLKLKPKKIKKLLEGEEVKIKIKLEGRA
jgi:hypothetical protein